VGGTLFAGPWAGEFGWELCSWNPRLRKIAKGYDRVIVEGPAASEYLYEFADEYIHNETTPHSSDGYKGRTELPSVFLNREAGAKVLAPAWGSMGKPETRQWAKTGNRPYPPHPLKDWKCLAPENPEFVAEILCAFRPVKQFKKRILSDKEYPEELCVQLVDKLLLRGFSVACIGGLDNYYIPGTIDLRGTPLGDQCSAIGASKVVVGPSSGPLHLASLCKTPHVVWYNRPNQITSYARYENYWNPFDTPHTYLKQPAPTPEQIAEAVMPYIDKESKDDL